MSDKMVLDIRIHTEDVEQLGAALRDFLLTAAVADLVHDRHDVLRPVHVHIFAVPAFEVLVIIHIHHLQQVAGMYRSLTYDGYESVT